MRASSRASPARPRARPGRARSCRRARRPGGPSSCRGRARPGSRAACWPPPPRPRRCRRAARLARPCRPGPPCRPPRRRWGSRGSCPSVPTSTITCPSPARKAERSRFSSKPAWSLPMTTRMPTSGPGPPLRSRGSRRGPIGEREGVVGPDAPRRDGGVAGQQPGQHRRLVRPGDEPQDVPRPIEHRVGEGHPPAPGVRTGHGHVGVLYLQHRVARDERGRVPVGPEAEVDHVEDRRRARRFGQASRVGRAGGRQVGLLDRHGVQVPGRDRRARRAGSP